MAASATLNVVTFNMCSPPTLQEDLSAGELSPHQKKCVATGAVACHVFLPQEDGEAAKDERELANKYTRVPLQGKNKERKEYLLTHDPSKTERVIAYVQKLTENHDILCLQEVNEKYKEELEKFCEAQGFGFHFKMKPGNNHGTAVLYKKTALSNVRHFDHEIFAKDKNGKITNKSRFVTVIEGCTSSGKVVRIASAHFFGFESESADNDAIVHIMNARKSVFLMKISELFLWTVTFGSFSPKPDVTILGADTNVPQKKPPSAARLYHRIDVPQEENSIGGLFVDLDHPNPNHLTPLSRVKKPPRESVCALLVSPTFLREDLLPESEMPQNLGFTEAANVSDHAPVSTRFTL